MSAPNALVASPGASASSPLRTLLALSWPIVLARATQSVIGFTDALFVAPLGETELAAVTTGSLNSWSAIVMPTGTVFIVQSFVAQLRGRGEQASVFRYALYGLAIAAMAGFVALVSIPFIPGILGLFHYEPGVHAAMSKYLGIRLLSITAAVGIEALGNYYGGMGNTRPSMVAGIVAMSVNVLGCYSLVMPRFGLPGYGVAGAAWASVLGSVAGFLTLAVPFGTEALAARRAAPLGLKMKEFLRVLRFGIPNGLNWFLEFAAFIIFINAVVGHLGTRVLAAFNVVMQLNSVAFMPAFGLASGGAILVGEAIGKGEKGSVWPLVRMTAMVSAGWMLTVGFVYAVIPRYLMGFFEPQGTTTTELVDVGTLMLMFAVLWQLFDALGMTLSEALRAAGDTTWCMWARIVLAWGLFTPLGWAAVFLFHGGVGTIMTSLVVYMVALSSTLGVRFASGRWKDIQLVEEPSV